MANTIEEMLDQLADFESAVDVMKLKYQEMIDNLIPAEIREQIKDIEAEKKTALEASENGIKKLKDSVKQLVLDVGETVYGKRKECRYIGGKTVVDLRALTKLAGKLSKTNPEITAQIEDCIGKGEPYVSFYNRK